MDKMFEKRRSEAKKSIAPGQAHPYNQVDLHQSETERPPGDVHERVPWNEKAVGNERRTRSLVGELVARANLENPRVTGQAEIKYVQNGPPQEESVSRILERLKPDHNEHLRRSKRTSSEFKKPRNSLFDDIDDLPAVERYSKIHGLGDPWKKPLIYPKLGKKKTTVEFSDLERLDEGEFLNDNLLSFYLRFLENTLEEQRPHLAKRVYFFNTFFFATLMNTHKGRKGFNYEGVQKWTRNVDLFTFDYIVVPINEATHWYLAIICNLPALDRNLSLSGIDSGSCIDTAPTETFRNSTEPSPRSSSPTRDELEQEPVKLVDDEKEPDERGARTSFAEMSLDGEEKSPATGDTARLKNAGAAASTDEDKEMLDGHSQDASSLARPGVATDHHLRRDIEDPIDVLDDGRNKTGKSKKGKRKSGPPAVTKTPPDKPVIITFDSLGLARSSTIRILKDYLREEAKAKRGGMEFEPGQIKGITASQIPQQDNFYDCGVFLLGYVAKFLQDDPKDFIAKIIRREYDETKDWPDLNPSLLRSSIRGQVLKLHQDQVLERQKERDAQKSESDRGGLHEDQKQRSSPIPPIDQAKTVSRKPQLTTDEAVENPAKAPLSSQPATRKDALKTAMSIDPQMPTEGSMPSIPNKRIGRVTEVLVQEADQAKESQPAKVPSPKPGMNRPEKQKEGIPDSLDNEPSLVLVESQSQQDGSAPKSFYKSYPKPTTPTLVQRSPELPAEIQDSQPSQTSRTFANVIRRDSEEADSAPPAMQKRVLQEGPMVLIEEPRTARKRKTSDDGAGGATERHSKRTNEADLSKRETQDSAPVKRKRLGRKVQRSGEVINIDD